MAANQVLRDEVAVVDEEVVVAGNLVNHVELKSKPWLQLSIQWRAISASFLCRIDWNKSESGCAGLIWWEDDHNLESFSWKHWFKLKTESRRFSASGFAVDSSSTEPSRWSRGLCMLVSSKPSTKASNKIMWNSFLSWNKLFTERVTSLRMTNYIFKYVDYKALLYIKIWPNACSSFVNSYFVKYAYISHLYM